MKMEHGLKTLALKLNLLIVLLFAFNLEAKTLKVDTVTPSVTNGDFTITPNGTGDIVIGSGSGFVKLTSGILSNQELIDVASEVSGVLPIANGGTGSATQNFVDLTTAQTVSGVKTLSDLLDANAGADIEGNMTLAGNLTMEGTGALKLPEGTTAQQPAGADGMIRFNSDLDRFEGYKESAAAWGEIGGGGAGDVSGVGGINYLADNNDSDFEISVSNWVAFDDGSVTVPVDGTGGSPTLTCTRNTTTPIRGDGDLQVTTPAADSQGEGCSVDFDIDKGMQAQKLTISAWYDLSGVDDDDFAIFVYDKTNTNLIRVNGEDLKAGKGVLYAQFQAASNSTAYRLIIMNVDSSNTTARSLYFDEIAVSPTRLARGAIVTEWKAYIPTITGLGTITNSSFKYRRVGSNIEVSGTATAGTPIASIASITLPSGLSVSTSVSSANHKVGSWVSNSTVTSNFKDFVVIANSSSGNTLGLSLVEYASNLSPLTTQNGNQLIGSGLNLSFEFSVPIQGWGSSGTLSEDLGGRDVIVSSTKGSAQSVTSGDTVTFAADRETTTSFASGVFTAPETGDYDVSAMLTTASVSASVGNFFSFKVMKNTSTETGASNRDYCEDTTSRAYSANYSGTIYLLKGETLEIEFNESLPVVNLNAQTRDNYFHIAKRASPQTKFESATVAARYTSNNGQSVNSLAFVLYEDTDFTKGSISYSSATGLATISVSGTYGYCYAVRTTTTGSNAFYVQVNGVSVDEGYRSTGEGTVRACGIADLVKGDTIGYLNGTGATRTLVVANTVNSMNLWRIK